MNYGVRLFLFKDCQKECRKADVTGAALESRTVWEAQKGTGLSEKQGRLQFRALGSPRKRGLQTVGVVHFFVIGILFKVIICWCLMNLGFVLNEYSRNDTVL